jgi:error-prone DNA polymerase
MAGMARKGITGDQAAAIYLQILSFANFGFAESHALSFAKLVYASSWCKLHYPGAFLAALLRAQPMGFYSAQSLVHDTRRHGVEVLRPDLTLSRATADLEPSADAGAAPGPTGLDSCLVDGARTEWVPGTPDPTPVHRRDTHYAVRLGLDSVRGISTSVAERIVTAREERPFADQVDLSRRAGLDARQLEALATAGVFDTAFTSGGLNRRQALWNAGWTESEEHLEGVRVAGPAPMLPEMDDVEITMADMWATGITPGGHPFEHLRERLRAAGIKSVADTTTAESGRRVHVAGLVTHRQRPGTAGGVTFLNREDESGMLNVICTVGVWRRYRTVANSAAAMVIRGFLERQDGVTNLVADRLEPIETLHAHAGRALQARHRSRDFH